MDPAQLVPMAEHVEELVSGASLDGSLRRFELQLLDELGYRLNLYSDARTGAAINPEEQYLFDAGYGLVASQAPQHGAVQAYRGSDIQAMAAGNFDGPARQAARRLLKEVLAHHLGAQPLRSRDLFRSRIAPRGKPRAGGLP